MENRRLLKVTVNMLSISDGNILGCTDPECHGTLHMDYQFHELIDVALEKIVL